MLLVTLGTVLGTIGLAWEVPKGFLPIQDTGLVVGGTFASPDISFQAMAERQRRVVDAILTDPAVLSVGQHLRRQRRLWRRRQSRPAHRPAQAAE